MLEGLSERLKQGIDKISKIGVVDKEEIDELIRDIQRALLSSDVDVTLVMEMSEKIRKRGNEKLSKGLSRKEHVIKVVYEELIDILGGDAEEPSIKPKKILFSGLYGTGKTSTCAKIAKFYQKKGLTVGLVCCDVFRPAAYEQLKQLAEKIDASFYGNKDEKDSSKIAIQAVNNLKNDVIIFDSSGRNALDKELIEEIKTIDKEIEPDERILLIPADLGQAAKEQSKAFSESLDITSIIITKMDATGKGGGALIACKETGSKVIFITTGEGVDSLEPYNPKKFVARLIGFPDIESLIEKAKENIDEDKAKKMLSGEFTIDEFYSQFESLNKMGSIGQIMDMIGLGSMKQKVGNMDIQEEKIKKWKYIIQSMTKEEKNNPEIINITRIERISKGSGTDQTAVREIISNYKKSKKMIKMASSKGMLKRGNMQNMFKKFGL